TTSTGGVSWVSFQLESTVPPLDIAGDYTLTLTIDDACVAIPANLRTRAYAATIAPAPSTDGRSRSHFTAAVRDAPLLRSYDTFGIGMSGDYAGFFIGDDGPGLVERVAPKTFLAFGAWGGVPVGSSRSTISADLPGFVEYC